MIQSSLTLFNRFTTRVPAARVCLRRTAVWLFMSAALCFGHGCYDGRREYRRNERQAVAQRSKLPASQQEALAKLKEFIPEHLFVERVKIAAGTVFELSLAGGPTDSDLAAVANLPDLEVLDCAGSEFTDAGLIHLKTLKNLEVLGLPRGVSGPGLAHLEDLPKLREVYFWNGGSLTDEAMVHLSHLKNLQTIRVKGAPISDEGLKHLSSLKHLRHVDISWCRGITDKGLSYLMDCPALRELNVTETGITPAAVARFRRARPECKVTLQLHKKVSHKSSWSGRVALLAGPAVLPQGRLRVCEGSRR